MAKITLTLISLLFLYSCVPPERYDDVIPQEVEIPIVITKSDTVYVTVDIPLTLGQKYTNELKKYIGTREATGKNDGEAIKQILLKCGINFPQPWCACYLHTGLVNIGLNGGPVAGPGYTPFWFKNPKRIRWVRDKSPESMTWEQGWIGGIYFRSLGRIGHVAAIIEDFGDGYVLTIEGNTNAQGGREGNGVYLRIRHKSEFYMVADWLTDNEYKELKPNEL